MSQPTNLEEYKVLKVLLLAAILDDNIKYAKRIFEIIGPIRTILSSNNYDRLIALNLQLYSDDDIQESYNIKYNPNDSYLTIYEKVHVNLFFKLLKINQDYVKMMFDNYSSNDGQLTDLKRKILLTLIKGNNSSQTFEDFKFIAGYLIDSGLDVNFTATTYDGYTMTPIQYAEMLRYFGIAKYLKEHKKQ